MRVAKSFNKVLSKFYDFTRINGYFFNTETESKYHKALRAVSQISFYKDDYIIVYEALEEQDETFSIYKVLKNFVSFNIMIEILKPVYTTGKYFDSAFNFVEMYTEMKKTLEGK